MPHVVNVLGGVCSSVTPGLPVTTTCQDGLSVMVVRWAARTLSWEPGWLLCSALALKSILLSTLWEKTHCYSLQAQGKPENAVRPLQLSVVAILSYLLSFKCKIKIGGHLSKPWKVGKYHKGNREIFDNSVCVLGLEVNAFNYVFHLQGVSFGGSRNLVWPQCNGVKEKIIWWVWPWNPKSSPNNQLGKWQ